MNPIYSQIAGSWLGLASVTLAVLAIVLAIRTHRRTQKMEEKISTIRNARPKDSEDFILQADRIGVLSEETILNIYHSRLFRIANLINAHYQEMEATSPDRRNLSIDDLEQLISGIYSIAIAAIPKAAGRRE